MLFFPRILPLSNKSACLDRYAEPDKGWVDRSEANWPAPYWDIDTGMAAMLILLTAVDAGLGALFFGRIFGFGQRARQRLRFGSRALRRCLRASIPARGI